MNQYIEQCENCHLHNENVKRAINEFGYCNQKVTQEFFQKKDVIIANEQDPHIAFCKPCWKGIQENGYDPLGDF